MMFVFFSIDLYKFTYIGDALAEWREREREISDEKNDDYFLSIYRNIDIFFYFIKLQTKILE